MTIQLVLVLAIGCSAFQLSFDPLQGVGDISKLLFHRDNPAFLRLALLVQTLKAVDPEIHFGLPCGADVDKRERLQSQRHNDADRDLLVEMPCFFSHDFNPTKAQQLRQAGGWRDA